MISGISLQVQDGSWTVTQWFGGLCTTQEPARGIELRVLLVCDWHREAFLLSLSCCSRELFRSGPFIDCFHITATYMKTEHCFVLNLPTICIEFWSEFNVTGNCCLWNFLWVAKASSKCYSITKHSPHVFLGKWDNIAPLTLKRNKNPWLSLPTKVFSRFDHL